MKYSIYNIVWYDGTDAYVSKYILKSSPEHAQADLQDYWNKKGYDGEVLKLDYLYSVNLENILSLKDEHPHMFRRFNEMYF